MGELEQEWTAGGHPEASDWFQSLGQISALVLVAIFVILIARAIARQRRYRAVVAIDDGQKARLVAEVVEVEKRTVGEIVPVVLERSDAHPQAAWMAGTATLLAGVALLGGVLPWDQPLLLLACQAAIFAFGFLCAQLLPDFKRLFVTERRATEMAQEQALQEFYALDLHETEAQTGVLLFVSLFERRVIILGDSGIDAKVNAEHWEAVDDAILAGVRRGDIATGLADGLRLSANVLEEHFPWQEGDRNEVPDRVVVRRE